MSLIVTLRRLLIALIVIGLFTGSSAFAFPLTMDRVGGATVEASKADGPCHHTAGMHSVDATNGKMPCNTIATDCVKSLLCAQASNLPERPVGGGVSLSFAPVTYWSSLPLGDGVDVEPDLSPPRILT